MRLHSFIGAAFLLAATFASAHVAQAHNLPYALVSIDLRTTGQAKVEVRCHVPALVMGVPQGHLGERLLPIFLGTPDAALEARARIAGARVAREMTLRADGRVLPPPHVIMPGAQVLKADARVPSSDPRPSAPIRFATALSPQAGTLDLALPLELGPAVVVITHRNGEITTVTTGDAERTSPLSVAGPNSLRGSLTTLATFIAHGFRHIIPLGPDHVLFISMLALGAPRLWQLVTLATTFTLAHSVTLTLAAIGMVSLPPRLTEPMIATSIAAAAVLNLTRLQSAVSWRLTLAVFAAGLLHGLGFAGALADLGLPQASVAEALVGFNVGAEFGQLVVILTVLVAVGWARGRAWYGPRLAAPASVAVACLATYWTVERLLAAA